MRGEMKEGWCCQCFRYFTIVFIAVELGALRFPRGKKLQEMMFNFSLKKASLDNRLNGVIKMNEKDSFDGD